tara:strand:- start:3066 stop:5426 length:2361 start_codon:yes stop_codon:yes gene_type:complete
MAEHTDFELEQFLVELHNEVNALAYSDSDGESKENKFTEYVMEILSEAGETEGTRLCPYEKENKWENIQFKINGYAIQDGFESVDVFISSFMDSSQIYRVTKSEFDKLIKWPLDFLNSALKGYLVDIEPSNEAHGLAKLIRDNRNDIVRVNVFILSNGNIPHDPPKNYKMKGFEEMAFNFHIWDAERLHRLSQSKNNREPIEIDFETTLGEVIPCLSMPSKNDLYECYLAIVPGSILATLYKNYGTRLLESNVRAFLQQTGSVNKGIRDTIRDEPHMFLPYNNGLATTAQEVKTKILENGKLVITGVKDFQIVNGGQTTASLYHTAKKFKADISGVFVQMKLTVIKDEDKKNETVPYISRFANSQNKVSELDLTSNNPFLQRLEELSRTTFAVDSEDSNKQTIWFFERVKGQYREALNKEPTKSKKDAFLLKNPRSQVIIKSEIAKYFNIFNQYPYHVSKGAQKNYNFFLKEVEQEFKKSKPGRLYWQDTVALAILFKATDRLFGRKNQDAIGDTNIKSHTVAYALSYFHFLTKNLINLDQIWIEQTIREDLLKEIKKVLIYVYNFLNSLDVALISEAAKAEKTWKLLRESKDHPIDMAVVANYLTREVDFKKRYKSDAEDSEEVALYDNLQKITSMGLRFWDGLCIYNSGNQIFNKYQENFLSLIRKKLMDSGTLTQIEIEKGVEILDHLKNYSLDIENVITLSKLSDREIADPLLIYNRLRKLTDSDWAKIIDLGEQSGALSFNEISVIRSVMRKLKLKEGIDIKRMMIIEGALKKLKKFGISY